MNKDKTQDPTQILYENQKLLQQQMDDQVALNQSQAQQLAQLQQQQQKRTLPTSELDLNLMLTDTVWGNLPPALKEKMMKHYITVDDKGNKFTTKEDLSALLGFYTRDLRLGNLSSLGGEIYFCEYHLDLANDLLKEGFVDPFLICLSRVASKLEISQSKGGFLRKRNSSFTSENITGYMEPPKRNLMGSKVKEQ
jgi:hypothetical protein